MRATSTAIATATSAAADASDRTLRRSCAAGSLVEPKIATKSTKSSGSDEPRTNASRRSNDVAFWRKGDKNFWCRGVLSDEVLRFRDYDGSGWRCSAAGRSRFQGFAAMGSNRDVVALPAAAKVSRFEHAPALRSRLKIDPLLFREWGHLT